MSVVEEVLEKQREISILTKQGDWYGSFIRYKELDKFKQDYLQERSKTIKLEVELYCELNKISLKDFCQKFGIEKYYLEKVMKGYIRPSQYFVDRIIRSVKK